jgi:hypothetical protein
VPPQACGLAGHGPLEERCPGSGPVTHKAEQAAFGQVGPVTPHLAYEQNLINLI